MKVIGLHGRKRSGKDTVAGIICSHFNYVQLAFADPIRQMLEVLDIPERFKEEKLTPIPGYGLSYTELMQTLGTGWGREVVSRTIWIRALGKAVIALQEQGVPGVVISDVRYEDEAIYVRQNLSGVLYEVAGDRGVLYNSHSSEYPLNRIYIDGAIYNTGSLEDLEDTVLEIFG